MADYPSTRDGRKSKAAAKRERIRRMWQVIQGLSESELIEAVGAAGIRTIEGRELSLKNQALLLAQRDSVSVVGGYRQWQAAGRQVGKGESGLLIWIPCTRENDDGGNETFFRTASVFDVSQTVEASEPVTAGGAS